MHCELMKYVNVSIKKNKYVINNTLYCIKCKHFIYNDL